VDAGLLDHPWECGLLLALMLACVLELGRMISGHWRILAETNRKEQLGTIRDGMFVLLSLLLGFSLALAGARFAERRTLLVEEAVSIGTAFLRAGTLPEPAQYQSRSLFREYVQARLDLDRSWLSTRRFRDEVERAKRIQKALWSDAQAVALHNRDAVTALYIETLNEMIDLHEKRVAAIENRVPESIWLLIVVVAAVAVFTRGLTITARFWLTLVLIPATVAIVVALIADLDAPSAGLIRLDERALQRVGDDLKFENSSK